MSTFASRGSFIYINDEINNTYLIESITVKNIQGDCDSLFYITKIEGSFTLRSHEDY